MKHAFLFCLFILLQQVCYGQYLVQHDLKSKKLYGKVKTVKTFYGKSTAYSIDTFDNDGYLLKKQNTDSNRFMNLSPTYFFHDASGHLYMTTYTEQDRSDTTTFRYNNTGQATEVLYRSFSYSISNSCKNQYIYDNKGNCIEEKTKDIDYTGKERISEQHFSHKYNSKNQLIEITTDPLLIEEEGLIDDVPCFYKLFEYFELNLESGFRGRAVLKYDSQNRVISEDLYDSEGKLKGKITCSYDMHGNMAGFRALGYNAASFKQTRKVKYQYDKYNNWIVKETTDNYNKPTLGHAETERRKIEYY